MATLTAAEEAAKHSAAHQEWILKTLAENGGACSYAKLVEVGEEHQCDTVGAMLKILKNRKQIRFKPMFLMYPMHKDEVVELTTTTDGNTTASTSAATPAANAEPSISDLRIAEEDAQQHRHAVETAARPKHVFKKKTGPIVDFDDEDSDVSEDES